VPLSMTQGKGHSRQGLPSARGDRQAEDAGCRFRCPTACTQHVRPESIDRRRLGLARLPI
jgi:hypothetical protein